MLLPFALLLLGGCHVIFAYRSSAADTSEPEASQPEASQPDGSDAELRAFGAPQRVAELSTGWLEDDPTLSQDRLEIFFSSSRAGGLGAQDIWTATRASVGQPWSTPINVARLNTPDQDALSSLSADGRALYFASNRAGGLGGTDIYHTARASRGSAWDAPELVTALSSSKADRPRTTSDPALLLISARRAGGAGDLDLYSSRRGPAGWSTPAQLPRINTSTVESDPWLDASETVLYFTTDRPGGAGGLDIWRATRASKGAPFTAPTPVSAINSDADEADSWLSPDRTEIYFSSNRSGSWDIYRARR